jgi:hypothetical protein
MKRASIPAVMTRATLCVALCAVVVTTLSVSSVARAQEISHYNPGVPNIRDFAMPPAPGLYGVVYNYRYTTDRLNDHNGNKVSSVTIGSGGGVAVNVDVDVNMYALAPALIWVSNWKVLGARYGGYILPSFANASVGAALATERGRGRNADTSQFGVGDLFVQPVWLDWSRKHWDFALGYGFYAPVGSYSTETVTLPVIGPIKTEAPDNIGLGFWTHQIQGAGSWYPWEHRATAVSTALTYEINGKKEGFDITPGQNLALNWGISQYLPLKKDKTLLLEVGPAGYSSWQITDDSGSAAKNPTVHDEVHSAGGQLGLTYVPWNVALNVHYFHEFAAKDRFQGQALGVNFAIKF